MVIVPQNAPSRESQAELNVAMASDSAAAGNQAEEVKVELVAGAV